MILLPSSCLLWGNLIIGLGLDFSKNWLLTRAMHEKAIKYELENYSDHAHNLLFFFPNFVLSRIKCVLFPTLGLFCYC